MEDDTRILLVLQFVVQGESYETQRVSLEKLSWLVVDIFRSAEFYAAVSSFPGWTKAEDMGDFGSIHPIFPVNGIDSICVQVQPSPVRESFNDPNDLSEAKLECRRLLAGGFGSFSERLEGAGHFANERLGACIIDFRNAKFIKCIKEISNIQEFKTGIVVLSAGDVPFPSGTETGDLEDKLFSFWLNLASPQPREVSLLI